MLAIVVALLLLACFDFFGLLFCFVFVLLLLRPHEWINQSIIHCYNIFLKVKQHSIYSTLQVSIISVHNSYKNTQYTSFVIMMSAAKNLFQAVRRSFTNNSNNNNNDDNNNNSNNNSNRNNNGEEEEEEEEHPYLSLYGMILPTQPQPQTQTLYSEITNPVITTVTTMATSITDPSGNNSITSVPQQQQQQQRKSSRHRY